VNDPATTPRRQRAFRLLRALYVVVSAVVVAALALFVLETTLAVHRPPFDGEPFVLDGGHYVTADPTMVLTRFTADKPDDAFRIFLLGGSQAMGSPYVHQAHSLNDELSGLLRVPNEGGIATWLDAYLQATIPDRTIEVINAAKGAECFGVATDVLDDIVAVGDADLVVVLSANNEGKVSFVDDLDGAVEALAQNLQNHVVEVSELSQQAELPVYLLTVPTNLRDWLPGEVPDYDEDTIEALVQQNRHADCIDSLAADPPSPNAMRLFQLARCHDALGQHDQARTLYTAARDRDPSFVRARSRWNDVIRAAPTHDHLTVIDLEHEVESLASDGIPGFDLFFDYCHFKLDANRRVSHLLATHIVTEFFGTEHLPHLATAHPTDILSGSLRRLYWLKRIKWFRARYTAPVESIRDRNTRNVIDNYTAEIAELDEMIGHLEAESTPQP
jgi:hypothetical protein